MGLFNFRKKDNKSLLYEEEILNSQNVDEDISKLLLKLQKRESNKELFYKAKQLLDSPDFEYQQQGRELMCSLAFENTTCDNEDVCLWMAEEFEKNNCFSAAAKWYKSPCLSRKEVAIRGYERCYNPFHIDPYFAIDGHRGSGTPHIKYENRIKEERKEAFLTAKKLLFTSKNQEATEKTISTIYQLATAYGECEYKHEAQFVLGDYNESVLGDLPNAAKWYKMAAEGGNIEATKCYADMLVTGRGTEKDTEKAMMLYKIAADNNQLESQFVIGQYYLSVGDFPNAKVYLQLALDNGYEPARKLLLSTLDENRDNKKIIYGCDQGINDSKSVIKRNRDSEKKNVHIVTPKAREIAGKRLEKSLFEEFHEKATGMLMQICSKNADVEFNLLPFIFCVGSIVVSSEEKAVSAFTNNWNKFYLKKKISNEQEFTRITEIYKAVLQGAQVRAEWYPADVPTEVLENPVLRCCIVLGDILVNPLCAFDYSDAPMGVISIFNQIRFCKVYTVDFENLVQDFILDLHNKYCTINHPRDYVKGASPIDQLNEKAYKIMNRNNLLDHEGNKPIIHDIYCPNQFTQDVLNYCSKYYSSKGEGKVVSECIITSFYGSICSSILYRKGKLIMRGEQEHIFHRLSDYIDVEYTDVNAESFLGTHAGEALAEKIWGIISEYLNFLKELLNGNQDKNLIKDAMRNAYDLGMAVGLFYSSDKYANVLSLRVEGDIVKISFPSDLDMNCYANKVVCIQATLNRSEDGKLWLFMSDERSGDAKIRVKPLDYMEEKRMVNLCRGNTLESQVKIYGKLLWVDRWSSTITYASIGYSKERIARIK